MCKRFLLAILGFAFCLCLTMKASEPSFLEFFKNNWGEESTPSYDLNLWAREVEKGNLSHASHLWGSIRYQVPNQKKDLALTANLYTLWKLNLPQTLVEEWLSAMEKQGYISSQSLKQLEKEVGNSFVSIFEKEAILFSPSQMTLVKKLPNREPYTLWKIWSGLQSEAGATLAMAQLKEPHPLRPYFLRTFILSEVKKHRLLASEKIVKEEAERTSGESQSFYYLELARIFYAQGKLDEAEMYYKKIPRTSFSYVSAQEELLWVWLRQGNGSLLRGALASFSFPIYQENFAPEYYVVRAISDLKLCFYDEAKKDFDAFLKYNLKWASEVDESIASAHPKPPPGRDWYSLLIVNAIEQRQSEMKEIEKLNEKSIAAALPAVGRQSVWKDRKDLIQITLERLEKLRDSQYRLQWKNNRKMLQEAIRKMQFVKLELLSQWDQKLTAYPVSEVSVANREKMVSAVTEEVKRQNNYPFDGVLWPDELFKVRSTAANQCL